MSDPFASMSPNDAAVALRTLPRRFRTAASSAAAANLDEPPDDATVDEVAARVGPDGHSASDLVAAASRHLDALDSLMERALVTQTVTVPAAMLEAGPPVVHHPAAPPFAVGVERLAHACTRLADRIDDADPGRWTTDIAVEGGGSTTPLELLQQGVATAVSCERAVPGLLRSVRGRR